MATITIQCPDEVLASLDESSASFTRSLALAAAMKFYELGRLSSGRAAELAGLTLREMLMRLPEAGLEIRYDTRELEKDLAP